MKSMMHCSVDMHKAEKQTCLLGGSGYQYDPSAYHYTEHPGKHCDYHMGRGSNSDHTTWISAATLRPTRTGTT